MEKEKTILEKVSALVFEKEEVKPEEKEVELAEVTTADGLILKYENLESGTAIVVVDAEGVETPADGDYTLEDGSIIVTAEGAVVEVKEAVVEEKEEQEMEEVVNPNDARIDALESKLEEVIAKFSAYEEKFNEFSKQPAAEEIKLSKKDIRVTERTNTLKDLSKFRK